MMIGAGIQLAPYVRQARRWTPADLFAAGPPGFWAGGFNPVAGRLWQDTGGTTPATIYEQPVGLVQRRAGSANPLQATVLSKPTLARWPRGGRRNLVPYSDGTGDWSAAGTTPPTILQSASYLGQSCVAVSFAQGQTAGYAGCRADRNNTNGRFQVSNTLSYVGAYDIALSRALTGGESIGIYCTGASALGSVILTAANSSGLAGAWGRMTSPSALPVANGADYPVIYLNQVVASPVTVHVRRIQVETGAAATAYQRVTTANDVTEAGVRDVWHLYNDGGDALAAVWPAGDYGLATMSATGAASIGTVTSNGSTAINIAPTSVPRLADVILRKGAFSAPEIEAVTAYWTARYGA